VGAGGGKPCNAVIPDLRRSAGAKNIGYPQTVEYVSTTAFPSLPMWSSKKGDKGELFVARLRLANRQGGLLIPPDTKPTPIYRQTKIFAYVGRKRGSLDSAHEGVRSRRAVGVAPALQVLGKYLGHASPLAGQVLAVHVLITYLVGCASGVDFLNNPNRGEPRREFVCHASHIALYTLRPCPLSGN